MLNVDLSLGQGGMDNISNALCNIGSFLARSDCLLYFVVRRLIIEYDHSNMKCLRGRMMNP